MRRYRPRLTGSRDRSRAPPSPRGSHRLTSRNQGRSTFLLTGNVRDHIRHLRSNPTFRRTTMAAKKGAKKAAKKGGKKTKTTKKAAKTAKKPAKRKAAKSQLSGQPPESP